jgi:hypothetical protein
MSYKRKENYESSMLGIAVSFGLAGFIIVGLLIQMCYESI